MKSPFSNHNSYNNNPPIKNNSIYKNINQNNTDNSTEYNPIVTQTISSQLNITDFLRTSSECIPDNEYLIKNTGIPFGINITPFPDIDTSLIPQYSFGGGNGKIPRCAKCQSFINLYSKLGNNSWKCNICSYLNQFNNIDEETVKKIIDNNNEIYEIFANSDYIENSPMSSNYVFILDVTNKSIANGSIKIFIESLRYIVNNKYFINEERTFLSFITFDHSSVCFYKMNKKINTMQILEMSGDVPFVPDNKKNLIFSVDDNLNIINSIIDSIDNLYNINNIQEKENKESDQLIFAIECGKTLLQKKGGKLIVINSSTSWKNRMDLINKEYINNNSNNKEEDNNIFIMVGKSLTKYQITCDIFEIQNKNEMHNVNDLLNICNYSNGNFLFYKNFNSTMHNNNLFNRLIKSITNQRAYESIIQYYTTPVVTLNQNLSILPVQKNNSFLLPCIDVNQTYSFILHYKEFKSKENQELINESNVEGSNFGLNSNEEKIKDIYIQFSIVYTNLEGIRIIRVINKKINICNNKMDYLKNIDIESACATYTKFLVKSLKESHNIFNAMAEYKYKYYIYALSLFKQANLDELITSFLICYLGIMKNKYFCLEPLKYKLNVDEMCAGRNNLLTMKIDDLLNIIIPKIYDITNVLTNNDTFDNIYYQPVNLSKNDIKKDRIYLIDNGIFLNFHFCEGENNQKRLNVFFGENMTFDNVGTFFHSEQTVFEDNVNCDDFEVEKCKEIINIIRNKKINNYQDIFFSFEKSPSEAILKQCLLNDNYCPWFQFSYKDTFNKI
jgi:hypothetical protein